MSFKGAKCYTDGLVDTYCLPGTQPDGFILGSTNNGHNKGRITYYSEQENKIIRLPADIEPPTGYVIGYNPRVIEKTQKTVLKRGANKNNVVGKSGTIMV